MICLLLNTNDVPGAWLYHALLKKGVEGLVMVSADELAYAAEFTCEATNGTNHFSVRLQNGLELNKQNITATLNRISCLPATLASNFALADRDYVAHEQLAIFTHFLNLLPNQIFNASSGRGLSGRYRSRFEWMQLAQLAGFDVDEVVYENFVLHNPALPNERQASSIIYFNGQCHGNVSQRNARIDDMCISLGLLSKENILEINFYKTIDRIVFTGASTLPGFNQVTTDFLDHLKNMLQ